VFTEPFQHEFAVKCSSRLDHLTVGRNRPNARVVIEIILKS